MWLLRVFPRIARAAAFVYYRVRYTGGEVPKEGPVLLVANHPNSLLDPMLVVAGARRPVRFLAKAPLFTDKAIGWLVRAAGAIPVYRRHDDPTLMARNLDTFRAAYEVLGQGYAVGIFPEGVSHSEPSLVPLKTGAARIALGAWEQTGETFPIIPVGLVFRQKDVFRSDAIVYVGQPVKWEELVHSAEDRGQTVRAGVQSRVQSPESRGETPSPLAGPPARAALDGKAVHELTERITESLRQVTLNLARWEDRPLVECAVRIWEAERGEPPSPGERVARLDVTTRILEEVRLAGNVEGLALARDVELYCLRLARLNLRPADIVADVRLSRGVRWAATRVHLLMPLGVMIVAASAVLFWVPYRVTGAFVRRLRLVEDLRSTWKLLAGFVFYLLWLVVLVTVAGARWGWRAALAVALGVPALGIAGVFLRERWRWAWNDVRRFFLLRSRRELVAALRKRQRELGSRIEKLFNYFVSSRGRVAEGAGRAGIDR